MMNIKLHPKAEDDLKEALDYYVSINEALKRKFIDDLDVTFSKIGQFPKLYSHETPTTQKVLLYKFPYIIIYEHYQNDIMIIAIFHTKRNPNILKIRE